MSILSTVVRLGSTLWSYGGAKLVYFYKVHMNLIHCTINPVFSTAGFMETNLSDKTRINELVYLKVI